MSTPLIWMRRVLRLLLAAVLIAAAVGKLRAGLMGDGPQTVYDAWLGVGSVWHYLFVAFELLLAAWLLSGLWPRWSAAMTAGVLVVFSLIIALEMRKTAPRPCGCLGGGTVQMLTPDDVRSSLRQSLMMNGVLIFSALWLMGISGGRTVSPSRENGGHEDPKAAKATRRNP